MSTTPARAATLIRTTEAARILGLSADHTRELDSELQPERVSGWRVYNRATVEAFAKKRAAKQVKP